MGYKKFKTQPSLMSAPLIYGTLSLLLTVQRSVRILCHPNRGCSLQILLDRQFLDIHGNLTKDT